MVNRLGPRKPWLALVVALMAPLIASLWFVHPGPGAMPIWAACIIMGAIPSLLVFNDVLHNALLSHVASPAQAPVASGLAYSLLNGISTALLVFVLWAFVLPGKVSWSFIPHQPLFGLNPLAYESERIVAPLTAAVLALGALPMLLFSPDAPKTGVRLGQAFAEGWRELKATASVLRGERNMALFLAARMVYTDGKTALLAFGGLYAKGVMHWHVLEMLAYGILLSIFAVLGGFVGAALDRIIGPRRAIMIEVLGSLICVTAATGMNPHTLFYVIAYDPAAHAPLWNGPMFRTLPEVLYLMIGFGTAVFVTAAYSSSRILLTRLAPPDKLGSFFGLYALSGTATMWLGSMMVGLFTALLHTQQAGFIAIGGLLVVGLAGMLLVKGGDPLPASG
jgi:UMF1 family MFS transporter